MRTVLPFKDILVMVIEADFIEWSRCSKPDYDSELGTLIFTMCWLPLSYLSKHAFFFLNMCLHRVEKETPRAC